MKFAKLVLFNNPSSKLKFEYMFESSSLGPKSGMDSHNFFSCSFTWFRPHNFLQWLLMWSQLFVLELNCIFQWDIHAWLKNFQVMDNLPSFFIVLSVANDVCLYHSTFFYRCRDSDHIGVLFVCFCFSPGHCFHRVHFAFLRHNFKMLQFLLSLISGLNMAVYDTCALCACLSSWRLFKQL